MAPRSSTARKTLSAANLAALGADRLAGLLLEATVGDANLKRSLKLALAAEVGPADLALEIDKRLSALAASRTRVSWRKRPELLADLQTHRRAIVETLAPRDPDLALERLVAWLDLFPDLSDRVKDPKGELGILFAEAATDLGRVSGAADPNRTTRLLADAVETRLSTWAVWIGRATPGLTPELAGRLLGALTDGRPLPTGRRALVVRRLADRAGDAEAWAATFTEAERSRPEIGAEVARRLAEAGQSAAARAALDASRPRDPVATRPGRRPEPALPCPAWDRAEILVLEAEGRLEEAQTARWALFEQSLDPDPLRAYLSRLPDFEDVEALDRAHALAAHWPDPLAGLRFLMAWPALREAAGLILARVETLSLTGEEVPLWIARLEPRYPSAALILIRGRALGLMPLGPSRAEEVRALSAEAAELARRPGAADGLQSHAAFIDDLEALAAQRGRRGERGV
jgi:hypothetical protein